MCAVTLVHTHIRTPRHWIKVWTHTVSGVCVTLCVLAKPVKRNHSSRNIHFAQRSLISTVTQAVKFQRRFCPLTSGHISSLQAAPPGLCDRLRNWFYLRCSFSTNTRPAVCRCSSSEADEDVVFFLFSYSFYVWCHMYIFSTGTLCYCSFAC